MQTRRPPAAWLYGICFVSGFAALVFEHVWFRKAGLVFGNGVWATSLVLAAFMAGLALGSLLAARWARRTRRPLRAYAAVEGFVALSGALVVLLTPWLGSWLAPALGQYLERPWLLNPLRLGAAFALMCTATTAMGATLPLLARAGESFEARYGVLLGRLYGWNTLGAMCGALAGEAALYGRVGVRGAGLCAAAISLSACALAGLLDRRAAVEPRPEPVPRGLTPQAFRVLLQAALAGATLLALEVIWTRFLQLFSFGSSLMFALLLACVLGGIGLGGLLAGLALSRRPGAGAALEPVALLAGALVAATYLGFTRMPDAVAGLETGGWAATTLLAGVLALPVSLLSGAIFTLAGARLEPLVGEAGRATGLVTLANTLGALVGALLAGFALLPRLGLERSFWVLALAYGLLALLGPGALWKRAAGIAAAALWLAAVAFFPRGLMLRTYLPRALSAQVPEGGRIVAVREGLTETSSYVEVRVERELYEHRLVTNNYNMSGTGPYARRYMKLFVYLPVALHPAPRQALLISYGVGSTAKALTDTRELRAIDVVDISKDVLELSALVYPDPRTHPLRDPRVRVHVEDGRYFLEATRERYDLITAEPPPPKLAGIVNLYSLEYFRLVRKRLQPGGFASYWLPLHSLEKDDARAITAAFCGAFPDCSLWKGIGLQWMLVGSNDARERVSDERFRAQWDDGAVAAELRALGFEKPEQLGALFVADGQELRAFVGDAVPLRDDFPQRLLPYRAELPPLWHVALGDVAKSRARFEASAWVERLWPAATRASSAAYFDWQAFYDRQLGWDRPNGLEDLHAVLAGSELETLPLMMLDYDADLLRIARERRGKGDDSAFVWAAEAAERLARRDYAAAAAAYAEGVRRRPGDRLLLALRLYTLTRAGRAADTRLRLGVARSWLPPDVAGFLERLSAES